MKAHLRSVRLAPKKANLIAKMVRGMSVTEAITALEHTNKKGARIVEKLLKSAVANAHHNDKQHKSDLMIKSIVVNQAMGLPRGVPKARGSMRPMMKFMSHIDVVLGITDADDKMQKTKKTKKTTKTATKASQSASNPVKDTDTSSS
jgi:large subunit ribosomal protein L22